MGTGLQAWDSQGRIIFDTNSRTLRVKGVATITTEGTGQITVALAQGKELFAFPVMAGYIRSVALSQINANTIEWSTLDVRAGAQLNIFYGEF